MPDLNLDLRNNGKRTLKGTRLPLGRGEGEGSLAVEGRAELEAGTETSGGVQSGLDQTELCCVGRGGGEREKEKGTRCCNQETQR